MTVEFHLQRDPRVVTTAEMSLHSAAILPRSVPWNQRAMCSRLPLQEEPCRSSNRAPVASSWSVGSSGSIAKRTRRCLPTRISSVSPGEYSLKVLTKKAVAAGLTNRTGGGALARSRIHQVLQNPIYYGEFYWLGQLHQGLHKPVISRDLYDRVQAVFAAANHPRHTKRRHALAGLVTCGRCGCAFTAEIKKGQYVYYHCTGHRGPCGNTYVREEELIRQFGELLKQVRIPTELAGKLATVLRESQTDKEKFVRTSMLRLQQQQMLLRSKLDRVYEDRLSDAIPEELWNSKSAALQDELRQVRTEMERHEVASQAYETAGLQILELAQTAYSSYVAKNPHEQARLIKTLVSNSTFDRGSLSPTYVKPFDVFAKGSETGDWLLR